MITITDIANELGISPATVSRALNQSRLVAPDLTKKISRTADKLGYKKRVIRRHRGRAILNIKLVLPHHREPERSLFYDLSALIEGIQSGFKHCGINLLCETASPKFNPYPHKKGGDLDGVIFAFNRPGASTLKSLRAQGTPFVVLNREIPGMACVASQNKKGLADIVAHLKEGRKDLKPAFVSLTGLGQVGEERLAGMVEACAGQGVSFDVEDDSFHFETASAITTDSIRTMAGKYNALVCANDIIGAVVVSEADRLGIPIPTEISVTGFDNSPLRNLTRPLLTTVSLPIAQLAKAAASGLESQIIEHTAPEEIVRIAGQLMIGESS